MHFLAPALLLGLVAAALPWIIHRIGRRRARPVRFAAMELLLRAEREVSARRRLRDVALLVARTALAAALPLAFARPFAEVRSDLPAVTTHSQSAVIVLDDSASMRRQPAPRRDAVRRRARRARATSSSTCRPIRRSRWCWRRRASAAPIAELSGDRARVSAALAGGHRLGAPRRLRRRAPARDADPGRLDARRSADLRHHRSAGDRLGGRHAGAAGRRARRSSCSTPAAASRGATAPSSAWAPSPPPRRGRRASRWSRRSRTSPPSRRGAWASRCASTAPRSRAASSTCPRAAGRASASSTPCRAARARPRS